LLIVSESNGLAYAALCYHGWLRVGTGFALLQGMVELDARAEEIDIREAKLRASAESSYPYCTWQRRQGHVPSWHGTFVCKAASRGQAVSSVRRV
jgi:hypothetical protein